MMSDEHGTMNTSHYPRVMPAGDAAVTVEFGDDIAPDIHDRALAFAIRVPALNIAGIIEVVPTYRSATVYVDPMQVEISRLMDRLATEARNLVVFERGQGRCVEIPVLYGGDFGPDLTAVAAFAGRPIQEVIALHTSVNYRCYMLGFSPGFPYLGRVPDAIAMPRLSDPRAQVPGGSVGIAGIQTGIYPQASPGGWRVIGRTPRRIYDPSRPERFLIAPGDRVQFRQIDHGEFERLSRDGE